MRRIRENPHVARRDPQFPYDVSVADDHNKSGSEQKDKSLIDCKYPTVSFVFAVEYGDGRVAVAKSPRIRTLLVILR